MKRPIPHRFPNDDRNFDPERADLAGEAIGLRVDPEHPSSSTSTVAELAVDRPIVKKPRWHWPVPAYFAIGGLAGAAATLGTAVRVIHGPPAERFLRSAQVISGVGTAAGAGLLVADLGRPERFLNMMRVFRPSSPMNMGVWILSVQSGSTWVAIMSRLLPGRRWRLVGQAAGVVSGLSGLPLCGYTGVLLGSTANPMWHESRRHLPPLFVASASSAGAAALTLAPGTDAARRSAELFGIAARAADLTAARSMHHHLEQFPAITAATTKGEAGQLDRAATVATGAALVGGLIGLRFPLIRRLAAVAAIAGSVFQRFAVSKAGEAASLDPQCVIETQTRR